MVLGLYYMTKLKISDDQINVVGEGCYITEQVIRFYRNRIISKSQYHRASYTVLQK